MYEVRICHIMNMLLLFTCHTICRYSIFHTLSQLAVLQVAWSAKFWGNMTEGDWQARGQAVMFWRYAVCVKKTPNHWAKWDRAECNRWSPRNSFFKKRTSAIFLINICLEATRHKQEKKKALVHTNGFQIQYEVKHSLCGQNKNSFDQILLKW